MYKRHTRDYSSYTWLGDEQEQSYAQKMHLTPITKCYGFIENDTPEAMSRATRSLLLDIQNTCHEV